jgi:hypothetical protein
MTNGFTPLDKRTLGLVTGKAMVGIRDTLFDFSPTATPMVPRLMLFDRSGNPSQVTVFTDKNLEDVYADPSPTRVAWLLEPPEVHPDSYKLLSDPTLRQHFDLILTHQKQLLVSDPKHVYMPLGGCWVAEPDWKVHEKTNGVSIIASSKNFLEGHARRHAVVQQFGDRIDGVFGSGYRPIDNKIDGLRDFRYTLVIENVRRDYFFTEKLIDAFVTGTVPLFWGCPDIARFFNPDGIIQFDETDELTTIFESLGPEDYKRRLPAIHDNLERAKQFAIPEDYLYKYILSPRFGI